jgi:N-acetyl-gamma-glutamyl-phosphate reductase
MSSGQAGGSARRLPALARLFDGAVQPLSPETLARDGRRRVPRAPRCGRGGARARHWSRPACASSTCPGAFRLRDEAARARWYPETHRLPAGVAYGLTERERAAVARAQLVANPGCYPTAALLALAPLADAGCSSPAPTSSSMRSPACRARGKTPSERTHFSEIHGSLAAYGVFNHRHGAEIEQGMGPRGHVYAALIPIDRGILATIYVRVAPGTTEEALADAYERAYQGATFVRLVGSSLPEIKHVTHTNFCDIGWRVGSVRPRDSRVGDRQPAEGRVGPGGAEPECDARPR